MHRVVSLWIQLMKEGEEEEWSVVIERTMMYLAERDASENDLEIKSDQCNLWQSEGLIGN